MLQPVTLGSKTLADYTHIFGREEIAEIRELAEPLKGARVVHVSATAFGGGVAEILYTLVPLMKDVGIDVEWQIIYGREEFFHATKLMHNALQGAPEGLTQEQWDTWRRYNEMNARELPDGWDVAVIHDPQPAALHGLVPEKSRGWVWRCHIDLSTPNPETIGTLLPYIRDYPETLFHLEQYVPAGLNGKVNVVPPAIDPLAPKNMALSPDDASYVCGQFGIDVDRPLMVQVSRFDPWKDPLGVIDAYKLVKEERPDVQLALVGSMASDDPEGWDYYNATVAHADGDPDIFILNNFNNVGSIEVNAFQSHADVVIQKSIREGFGLTVSEALWKGKAFVGGDVGGIPLQVEQGVTGYLVRSPEQCAARCADILQDPALGKALGRRGKAHVRKHFLTPRYLRDYLKIFQHTLGLTGAAEAGAAAGASPDGAGPGGPAEPASGSVAEGAA